MTAVCDHASVLKRSSSSAHAQRQQLQAGSLGRLLAVGNHLDPFILGQLTAELGIGFDGETGMLVVEIFSQDSCGAPQKRIDVTSGNREIAR